LIAEHRPFAQYDITETSDIEVNPRLRHHGTGGIPMGEAERKAFGGSEIAGFGFGILADYDPGR